MLSSGIILLSRRTLPLHGGGCGGATREGVLVLRSECSFMIGALLSTASIVELYSSVPRKLPRPEAAAPVAVRSALYFAGCASASSLRWRGDNLG